MHHMSHVEKLKKSTSCYEGARNATQNKMLNWREKGTLDFAELPGAQESVLELSILSQLSGCTCGSFCSYYGGCESFLTPVSFDGFTVEQSQRVSITNCDFDKTTTALLGLG